MKIIGQVVTLSASERSICAQISARRYQANRDGGVADRKFGKHTNEMTDFEGVAGELATYRVFDLDPRPLFDTSCRSDSASGGGDIVVNGLTIDVKTTTCMTGRLMVSKWKRGIDVYGLITGQFPRYVFRGFMSARELCQEVRLQPVNAYVCYVAKQHELKELTEIEP
jgi:hypothetical protein